MSTSLSQQKVNDSPARWFHNTCANVGLLFDNCRDNPAVVLEAQGLRRFAMTAQHARGHMIPEKPSP